MDLQAFLEKLNSRKLFALLLFVVLEFVDRELAHQVGGVFITYLLAQGGIDAMNAYAARQ